MSENSFEPPLDRKKIRTEMETVIMINGDTATIERTLGQDGQVLEFIVRDESGRVLHFENVAKMTELERKAKVLRFMGRNPEDPAILEILDYIKLDF